MDTTNRNLVIVGVVALIVGVLIGYVVWGTTAPSTNGDLIETGEGASESDAFDFTSEDETDSSDVMEDDSEPVASVGSGEESIEANTQTAGDTVVVDSVVFGPQEITAANGVVIVANAPNLINVFVIFFSLNIC